MSKETYVTDIGTSDKCYEYSVQPIGQLQWNGMHMYIQRSWIKTSHTSKTRGYSYRN